MKHNVRRPLKFGRLRCIVRYLFAAAYFPESDTAFDDVPLFASDLPPGPGATKANVEYALVRSAHPSDSAWVFKKDPYSPVTDTVDAWVNNRSDRLEQLPVNFTELDIPTVAPFSTQTVRAVSTRRTLCVLSRPGRASWLWLSTHAMSL